MREKVKIALLLIIPAAILAAILGYVRWVGFRVPNPDAGRGEQLVVWRRVNIDQAAAAHVAHLTGQMWAEQRVIEAIESFEDNNETMQWVNLGGDVGMVEHFAQLGIVEYNGNYYELTIMFADTFPLFLFSG